MTAAFPPWPPAGEYLLGDWMAEMEQSALTREPARRFQWAVYFTLGTLRYSHPRPLAIDGLAYRRRTRTRRRSS